ncbi:MAG: heme biosynthesis protein HemY [Hyphomicrobiales bacterium]|nr:heme biosynthesis protein HemY [Hyphomicrobiales bacterium]
MIRVLLYIALVALIAVGAVWLAEHPGEVHIMWQGQRLETSLMVLTAAALVLAVAAVLLWSIWRFIVRAPAASARWAHERRRQRAHRALTQGLVAVGSGDVAAARRFADEASRAAPDEPLTLLLSAQTAQLSGDRDSAARTFEQMAERDDTKLLGLHGLYIEARRRSDMGGALMVAEEAAKQAAVPAWAGQAVLEARCAAGDWVGALDRLERNMKAGLVDKIAYRRQRAVLLTAQALAAEDNDRDRAKALAQEAVKLAPDLVPAAALAGRMLGEAGDQRRSSRILETAWTANPHPDLAAAYAHLRPGDSARERLGRIEQLAAKAPGNVEAAIAVAHAALDAREFAIARSALAPLVAAPTRRVAALMAVLEDMQGDEGRAREWMSRAVNARRDPAWTADGFVSDRWLPVSPVTGRLDAFAWKDPLAGEDHVGEVLELGHTARPALDRPRDEPPPPREPEPPTPPAPSSPPVVDVQPVPEKAAAEAPPPARDIEITLPPPSERQTGPERALGEHPPSIDDGGAAGRPSSAADRFGPPERSRDDLGPRRPRLVNPVPIAPAVIPLVHAPDDPGPEPETSIEPAPAPSPEPPNDGWSIIRRLLKP